MKRLTSFLGLLIVAVAFTALPIGASRADAGDRTLGFVVTHEGEFGADCASGPFHDNISMAENGDTIQIYGCGSLSTKDKTADGGGRFVHKTSDGATIAGDWTALELLRYQSYGGHEEFEGLVFEGGVGSFLIHLSPDGGGSGLDAVLQVYCSLGDPPPGVQEGIRLAVQGGPNFNKQTSGETGFFT